MKSSAPRPIAKNFRNTRPLNSLIALAEGEEANVSTLIKLAAFGAVLWYGGMAVYDLPMRKLEAAVFKSTGGGAG
jgi:hypothetical protein